MNGWTTVVWFGLALSCPAMQDTPDPMALVQSLESESPEVREKARKQLVTAGKPAVPALKEFVGKTTKPEAKDLGLKILDEVDWPDGGQKDGLELSIKSGKAVYSAAKDTLELKIRLVNRSSEDKEFTFHHGLASSLFVRQGTSDLRSLEGGCTCGTYERGAVKVKLKPGQAERAVARFWLRGGTKGVQKIQADGGNIWPIKGPLSNTLEITVE